MNQIYKAFLASSKLEVASSRHCIFSNSSLVRSLSRSTKIAIVGSGKLCPFLIVLALVTISYIILFVCSSFVQTIILFCNRSSWILCHTASYKSWRLWHNCWYIWASACSFWLGEFKPSVHYRAISEKKIIVFSTILL